MKHYDGLTWNKKNTIADAVRELNAHMTARHIPPGQLISTHTIEEAKSDLADLWVSLATSIFSTCFSRKLEAEEPLSRAMRAQYLDTLVGLDWHSPFDQHIVCSAQIQHNLNSSLTPESRAGLHPEKLARFLDNLTYWLGTLPMPHSVENIILALLYTFVALPNQFAPASSSSSIVEELTSLLEELGIDVASVIKLDTANLTREEIETALRELLPMEETPAPTTPTKH